MTSSSLTKGPNGVILLIVIIFIFLTILLIQWNNILSAPQLFNTSNRNIDTMEKYIGNTHDRNFLSFHPSYFHPSLIEGITAVFAITTTDTHSKRWRYLRQTQQKSNMQFNFLPQIQSNSSYVASYQKLYNPRTGTGQLACFLSHMEAWKLGIYIFSCPLCIL